MRLSVRGRVVALSTSVALVGAITSLSAGGPAKLTGNVASANPRVGQPPNVLMPGFTLQPIAQGDEPLENPSGVITKFGLLSDDTRTEPDQNVYLEFPENPGGPTDGFDYGTHFLYQGHENAGDLAYVTRINMDVTDPSHHVTLLTPVGLDGKTHFNSLDGGTWNPFTRTLLFTQEVSSNGGGVVEITPGWPPRCGRCTASWAGVHIRGFIRTTAETCCSWRTPAGLGCMSFRTIRPAPRRRSSRTRSSTGSSRTTPAISQPAGSCTRCRSASTARRSRSTRPTPWATPSPTSS